MVNSKILKTLDGISGTEYYLPFWSSADVNLLDRYVVTSLYNYLKGTISEAIT